MEGTFHGRLLCDGIGGDASCNYALIYQFMMPVLPAAFPYVAKQITEEASGPSRRSNLRLLSLLIFSVFHLLCNYLLLKPLRKG